jgi:hypothetical protein
MKSTGILLAMVVVFLLPAPAALPQSPGSANQSAVSPAASAAEVPRLIKFSGTLLDPQDRPMAGPVGVTFALHAQQTGGGALWLETQNVIPDAHGNYTVLLGANSANGVPAELFTSGEARWLAVQVERQAEQPRVLLVSVPYALKAADAETLGGRPLSSFVLAVPPSEGDAGAITAVHTAGTKGPGAAATIGGGGSPNIVAKFDATGINVINSSIFDNGSVGIGTTSPGALLDVQLTTGAAANALNSRVILNNSSAITGSVLSAFKMTLLDESTAANLSKQPARFQYVRDVSATGGVTLFDAVMTATSFLNSNAPYQLRGVNIEGPTMATGTTLANFTGLYIGSGGGAGAVTNRFALVTEPGAGNVGIGTITPVAKLDVTGNTSAVGSVIVGATQTGLGIPNADFNNLPPAAVLGDATNATGFTAGVIGRSQSSPGGGVIGIATGVVTTTDRATGVVAVATATSGRQAGIDATVNSTDTTNVVAGRFTNAGSTAGLVIEGQGPGGTSCGNPPCENTVFTVDGAGNTMIAGNLNVTGTKSSVAQLSDGRVVALYAVESPENWYEDFGTVWLSHGVARVLIDPTFAQTTNTEMVYKVFLSPNGKCQGLYVAKKTATEFEVRELRHGKSNVAFDYRIVARRRGYESLRLKEVSH